MLPFPQEPMLARAVATLPEEQGLHGGSAYEPKFDGYRAMLFVNADGCRVQSRRGHDITAAFEDVAVEAADQLPPGIVIDGELVVWGSGKLDFAALQRRVARGTSDRRRPASFVAFDLLAAAGSDLRELPLRTRRQALELVMDGLEPPLQLAPQTTEVEVARQWLADYALSPVGIEGLVIKGLDGAYRSGRRGWMKLRLRDTVEVVVGAVAGRLEAPTHLVLGMFDDTGELVVAGTTSVLSTREQKEIAPHLHTADEAHPWPADLAPPGRWGAKDSTPVQRVDPTLVVEISADTSLHEGRWRHPTSYVRSRPDLSPQEIAPMAQVVTEP
ncbi:MAG: ATP-dependent ligase [Aeromicrobium sp.]|nr:ATP-dependent ligase [Aeromicrobium sp.]